MAKIDKLVFGAIVPPSAIALSVLTFVVFVRELGRLSELLITRNASLSTVGLIAAAILPGILIFSVPLAYLIGLLIGLSGLSGESQIIALRACGVPLTRLLRPVLLLAAGAGLVTAFLSVVVLPESNDIFFALKDRVSLRQVTSQVQPRVFNEQFPAIVFYLDDLTVDRQHWSRVFVADNSDPKSPRTVLAKEGTWVTDSAAMRLQLHLNDGTIYQTDPENPAKDSVSVFEATDIPVDLAPANGTGSGTAGAAKPQKPSEMSTAALWTGVAGTTAEQTLEQKIELHRRIAIPFSVVGFALVGLTLGISTKKGGRTSGFVLSLVLVLVFYALFANGLRLALVQKLPPWLGAWSANLLIMALGAALLGAAERGHWLSQWVASWRWTSRLEPFGRQLHLDAARHRIQRFDEAVVSKTLRIAQLSFPKVLDLYISRGFFQYFLWSTVVCSSLFVVLTLFDLLDDIIRNRIPAFSVISYFIFLTPQILILIIPMAVLLAILINFGILEKHSEVTALKAGGWSLYRIALPVFLMASGVCVGLYFVQDYVLPYANIRQDSLRNVIKGRPPQTMRPQRKWIFGESNRIFNYDYFDPSQNHFVKLNVFETDLRSLKILRRINASRARIDASGRWQLEDGWVRDFQSDRDGFVRFSRREFSFPEKAAYFQKEMLEPKESSKLTYLELKDYITYLHKSGYNATELQVELYKKISFPLSCVVMAVLGVPFSFSMGKRGAFYGITVSIMIAMSYWGIFSVFEQLGSYGFLVPLLAAWAPNLLFASAGLVLLFTIRT